MIFPVALGALTGSVAISSLESLPSLITVTGIAAVALVISVVMRFSQTSVFALCTALAALHATVWAEHELSQRLPDHLDRQSVWMEVVITDLPTRHERGWRFEARVLSARMSADEMRLLIFRSVALFIGIGIRQRAIFFLPRASVGSFRQD